MLVIKANLHHPHYFCLLLISPVEADGVHDLYFFLDSGLHCQKRPGVCPPLHTRVPSGDLSREFFVCPTPFLPPDSDDSLTGGKYGVDR